MDWLIWIGGYSVFSSFVNMVHGVEHYTLFGNWNRDEQIKKAKETESFAVLIDSVSSLLLWIWICWKFI